MASSSVSQEDVENDFERSSRRSRIRMARGRDVRGQHPATAANRLAADPVAEADDAGGEPRPLDASGYSGDHDASPKPVSRAKDKRPIRPSHPNKGKQQRDRDRRKLREKRRSSGVVHMPSTEMSSTGGTTSESEEAPAAQAAAGGEPRRPVQDAEAGETASGPVPVTLPERHFKSPRRNKSLSDLDADDEDNNQDCDSLGPPDTPAAGAVPPPSPPLETPAARVLQLEEENSRLRQLLAERDSRIAGLETSAERGVLEHHQLRLRNDALTQALSSLSAK